INSQFGHITSIGSAPITLTGIGGSGGSYGISINNYNGNIIWGGSSATGNITLVTNSLDLHQYSFSSINTSGTLTVKPYNAGTTIGVNNSSYTLNLDSTFLGSINSRVSNVIVGSTADTGTMNVSATTWSNPLSLLSGSGVITIAGAQSMGANNFLMQTNAT